MSDSVRGERHPLYGKHPSEETKEKIRGSLLGFKHGDEFKKKISLSMSGVKNPMWGRRHSEETKRKIRETKTGNPNCSGERHWGWLGGKSKYPKEWTKTLKECIRQRDHYLCRICLRPGHDCHHIDYDKYHNDPDNIIFLCDSCHMKTNTNRDYWESFLKEMMTISRD
jgi:hypothetical protein